MIRDRSLNRATLIGILVGLAPAALAIPFIAVVMMEPPSEVPPCDTNVNGNAGAEQLRARVEAGVASTECDVEQAENLAYLVQEWSDFDCIEIERDLNECEMGWINLGRVRARADASRIDAAIDLLWDCSDDR